MRRPAPSKVYWPSTLFALALSLEVSASVLTAYSRAHGMSWLGPSALALGAAAGVVLAWWHRLGPATARRAALALAVLGVQLPLLPVLLFELFPSSAISLWVAAASGAALGASWSSAGAFSLQRHGRDWLDADGLVWALHPVRALVLLAAIAITLSLASTSPLHMGCAAGLACTALSAIAQRTCPPKTLWLNAAASLVAALAYVHLDQRLPAEERRLFPNPILYATGDHNSQRSVFTQDKAGLELHVDGRLHLGALDSERYLAPLTRPPAEVTSALVLSPGSGAIAARLLARGVPQVTTVANSHAIWSMGCEQEWLRARSARCGAPNERHTLVLGQHYDWLRRDQRKFDYIVADLPPPLSYRDAKFYTRDFLALLLSRLGPNGVVLIPGLAPLSTPQAHETWIRTARSVGYQVAVRPLAVPSLGDWSFLQLTPRGADAPEGEDATSARLGTLDSPRVMTEFLREFMGGSEPERVAAD